MKTDFVKQTCAPGQGFLGSRNITPTIAGNYSNPTLKLLQEVLKKVGNSWRTSEHANLDNACDN